MRKDAAQGETRSLGFFHQPEGQFEGPLGLPIIGGGQGAGRRLRQQPAALLYLRSEALSFSELGTLESRPVGTADGCRIVGLNRVNFAPAAMQLSR